MKIKLIKNDKQLSEVLERVNELWVAESKTPERDELEVCKYSTNTYPIESASYKRLTFNSPVKISMLQIIS